MKHTMAILCGMLVATHTASAGAQEAFTVDSGMYFSLGIGGSEGGFNDSSWTRDTFGVIEIFEDDFTVTGLGSIGYQWIPEGYAGGFRFELEGSYRRSEVSRLTAITLGVDLPADGYLETIGIMANGFMDLNIGPSVTAYVGAGVGAVRETRRDLTVNGIPVQGKFTHNSAYQLMGGIGYRLTPGTIIGVDFRNMVVEDFSWPDLPSTTISVEFKEILFTIRLVG